MHHETISARSSPLKHLETVLIEPANVYIFLRGKSMRYLQFVDIIFAIVENDRDI